MVFKNIGFLNIFIVIALISLISYFIYLIAKPKRKIENFQETMNKQVVNKKSKQSIISESFSTSTESSFCFKITSLGLRKYEGNYTDKSGNYSAKLTKNNLQFNYDEKDYDIQFPDCLTSENIPPLAGTYFQFTFTQDVQPINLYIEEDWPDFPTGYNIYKDSKNNINVVIYDTTLFNSLNGQIATTTPAATTPAATTPAATTPAATTPAATTPAANTPAEIVFSSDSGVETIKIGNNDTSNRTNIELTSGNYIFKFDDSLKKNNDGRYEVDPFTLIINDNDVIIDGNNIPFKLTSSHDGIIQNGTKDDDGRDNCHIKNIDIEITGILSDSGGGICQPSFGKGAKNNIITNCHVDGPINQLYAGGICGDNCGDGGNVIIQNCSHVGDIQSYAGGICGTNCGSNKGNVIITNCYNSGSIDDTYAGGICGYGCGHSYANVTIISCYNSGYITSSKSGGICGGSCGANNGNVTIVSCYNSGKIEGSEAGGICGYGCGYFSGNVAIVSSYNSGTITSSDSGGICGSSCGADKGNVTIVSCFTNNNLVASIASNANIKSYYNLGDMTNIKNENIINTGDTFTLLNNKCKQNFPYNVIESLTPNKLSLDEIKNFIKQATTATCSNEIDMCDAYKWWDKTESCSNGINYTPKINDLLRSFMNCNIWDGYTENNSKPKLRNSCPEDIELYKIEPNWNSLENNNEDNKNNINNIPDITVDKLTPQCNFEAYGSNINSCINLCNGPNEDNWQIEGGCNYANCKRICENCSNIDHCEWLTKKQEDFSIIPKKLDVMYIPGNNSVELKWRCIDEVGDPTKKFIINYYKTYVQIEGINSKVVERVPGQQNYSVVLGGLENGTNYSFSVYQSNNSGNGPVSDVKLVVPNGLTYY